MKQRNAISLTHAIGLWTHRSQGMRGHVKIIHSALTMTYYVKIDWSQGMNGINARLFQYLIRLNYVWGMIYI